MAEYIEREALIEFVKQNTPNINGETIIECVERAIRTHPAADVVEVVRCSECKYFGKELKQSKHSCLNYQLPYCLENDYCGYGERKDDDEE